MMDQRIGKLEARVDKLEEKVDRQAIEFAETRVYVKEIYKKIDDLKMDVVTLSTTGANASDHNNDRWLKVIERAFWAIVTIVGYFLGKGN